MFLHGNEAGHGNLQRKKLLNGLEIFSTYIFSDEEFESKLYFL